MKRGRRSEPQTCDRCGQEIRQESKCFVKSFKNSTHEPQRYTCYSGQQYEVKRPPTPMTRLSIGLCDDCVSEVEALIWAWCQGGKAQGGAQDGQ